jgi:hypothetical protein
MAKAHNTKGSNRDPNDFTNVAYHNLGHVGAQPHSQSLGAATMGRTQQ